MGGKIFDFLVILFSVISTAVCTDEGGCRLSGLDSAFEGDDDCLDPALSLMQRHARFTSKNGAGPGADDAVGEAQFHELPVQASVNAPPTVAPEASRPWRAGAAVDVLGPIAFSPGMSLLALESEVHPAGVSLLAVGSDVHSANHGHLKSMGPTPAVVIYVLIPVAVIALVCILFCLFGRGKDVDQPEGMKASAGAMPQKSPLIASTLPASGGGAALPTQSSLASTSSSMTRDTQALPSSLVFSPISPSVRLPAEQQQKMPACLLFPTMLADVRQRSRSFNVFWGSLDSPWFEMAVKHGSVDHDRLELSEVHSGSNAVLAACNLANTEGSSVQEGSALWMISNKQLKANTRGLAYRSAKDNSKVRNAVAAWGSTVPGVDTGDGWLKVGEWYLPMAVDGHSTIVHTDAKDVPHFSGLQITRADGTPFATFKPMSGGQYAVVRNGATVCYVSIGTSSFLMEAKLPNGKRVAAVAREQVRVASGEMMLELCVEPQMDPVIMLIGCVAVLRQLPPHQDA